MQVKLSLLLTLIAILFTQNFVADAQTTQPTSSFPMNVASGEQKSGSTVVNVSGKISRQSDKGLIEAKFYIKKTGIGGVGYGKGKFVLLDKDGNTIWLSPEISDQCGADTLKGVSEKTIDKGTIDIPLDKLNAAAKVIVVVGIKDTGIFDNDEFKDVTDKILKSAKEAGVEGAMRWFKKVVSFN